MGLVDYYGQRLSEVCAITADAEQTLRVWVTVDHVLYPRRANTCAACSPATRPQQQGMTVRNGARRLRISGPFKGCGGHSRARHAD